MVGLPYPFQSSPSRLLGLRNPVRRTRSRLLGLRDPIERIRSRLDGTRDHDSCVRSRSGPSRRVRFSIYEAQVARIPDHRVVLAEKARHFIMLDDPAFLYATLDAFALQAHGGR